MNKMIMLLIKQENLPLFLQSPLRGNSNIRGNIPLRPADSQYPPSLDALFWDLPGFWPIRKFLPPSIDFLEPYETFRYNDNSH
jgi:hypothetical protein